MIRSIKEIVDIETLQTLANTLWSAAGFAIGILDSEGEVLVATGWQPICTDFHRIHPETELHCRQSDRHILDIIESGRQIPECGYIEYRCKNGMIDIGMPIYIDGNHLANIFFGQFFYTPPDENIFREQARIHGFDETAYLAALRQVPILTKEKVATILEHHKNLVALISTLGLQKLREIEARRDVESSEKRFRDLFDHAGDAILIHDMQLNFLDVNEEACRLTGYSRQELLIMTLPQVHSPSHRPNIDSDVSAIRACGQMVVEAEFQAKDGRIFPIEVSLRVIEYGGEEAIMGIVRDITERKRGEEELCYRETFERIVGVISSRFVAQSSEDLSSGIDYALSQLGPFTGADRSFVLTLDKGRHFLECRNEWCAPGILPQLSDGMHFMPDEFPWSFQQIREGKLLYAPNLVDLPPEATKDKALWEAVGIKSLIGVPIVSRGDVVGAFVLETLTEERKWEEKDILLLKTIGEIFGNAFENKKNHEALIQRKRLFRSFFENSHFGMAIASPDGRFLEVNQKMADDLGYDRKELLGLAIGTITHPDDVETTRSAYMDIRSGKITSCDYEKRYIRKDGTSFWAQACVTPIRGEDGEIAAYACLGQDVTEKKWVEETLTETRQRLAKIIDHLPDATFVIDIEGKIVAWNRAMEALTGVSKSEMVGEGDYAYAIPFYACRVPLLANLIIDPDTYHRHRYETFRQEGDTLIAEAFLPHLNGGRGVYVWAKASPLIDKNGEIQGAIQTLRDTTELKSIEKELRERELQHRKLSQEFAALLDAIPDVIIQLSTDMRIMWGNRTFAQIQGIADGAFDGELCYKVWHNRSAPCDDCPVVLAFASGCNEELLSMLPNGIWLEQKAIPLKDQNGNVTSVIEIVCDVTEKRRMQEETQRSARLASLGELSVGIAHEINNPNGIIQLNASLLQDLWPHIRAVLDERYAERGDFSLGRLPYSRLRTEISRILEETTDGARRINRIINDLKNFVLPDQNASMEPFDVNEGVKTAVRLGKKVLSEATSNFVEDYAHDLPQAFGNLQGLVQIVVNLLMNASQSLQKNDKGIFLSTRLDKEGEGIVIEIRDEGGGIPQENIARITDPFFTTRREAGGTGLGLSISLQVAKRMNASLGFTSTLGEGTTATLFLPLALLDN